MAELSFAINVFITILYTFYNDKSSPSLCISAGLDKACNRYAVVLSCNTSFKGVSAITDLQMTTEYHHYQVLFLGYRETVSMQGRCAKTPLESNKESSRNAGPSLLQGRAITPWVQKEDGDFNVR